MTYPICSLVVFILLTPMVWAGPSGHTVDYEEAPIQVNIIPEEHYWPSCVEQRRVLVQSALGDKNTGEKPKNQVALESIFVDLKDYENSKLFPENIATVPLQTFSDVSTLHGLEQEMAYVYGVHMHELQDLYRLTTIYINGFETDKSFSTAFLQKLDYTLFFIRDITTANEGFEFEVKRVFLDTFCKEDNAYKYCDPRLHDNKRFINSLSEYLASTHDSLLEVSLFLFQRLYMAGEAMRQKIDEDSRRKIFPDRDLYRFREKKVAAQRHHQYQKRLFRGFKSTQVYKQKTLNKQMRKKIKKLFTDFPKQLVFKNISYFTEEDQLDVVYGTILVRNHHMLDALVEIIQQTQLDTTLPRVVDVIVGINHFDSLISMSEKNAELSILKREGIITVTPQPKKNRCYSL